MKFLPVLRILHVLPEFLLRYDHIGVNKNRPRFPVAGYLDTVFQAGAGSGEV
tara:strand:- start:4 stop:159 length:156 start_codon:yes stop_codon:yes gene_type:complete